MMVEIFAHNVSVGRDEESDLVFINGLDWEGNPFRLYFHPTEERDLVSLLGLEVLI